MDPFDAGLSGFANAHLSAFFWIPPMVLSTPSVNSLTYWGWMWPSLGLGITLSVSCLCSTSMPVKRLRSTYERKLRRAATRS